MVRPGTFIVLEWRFDFEQEKCLRADIGSYFENKSEQGGPLRRAILGHDGAGTIIDTLRVGRLKVVIHDRTIYPDRQHKSQIQC